MHGCDLGDLALNERLAAKAWVHSHHQHQINHVHHIVDRFDRRAWVEGDPSFLAEGLDVADGAMRVGTGFGDGSSPNPHRPA